MLFEKEAVLNAGADLELMPDPFFSVGVFTQAQLETRLRAAVTETRSHAFQLCDRTLIPVFVLCKELVEPTVQKMTVLGSEVCS